MLSFHNDPLIKEKYLSRVIKHRELDNLTKGIGWENGKGCAVGCTLESYDHSRYPIELGLPEWLAYLEDMIFENLSKEDAMLWPELFLSSINVGSNLEKLNSKLSIKRIDRLLVIQNNLLEKNPEIATILLDTISAMELIKKSHEEKIKSIHCESEILAAELAVWSESAAFSVRSAAFSAESAARSAAFSARSAAWSARSAAWSERSAAWSESAAWSAESAARSEAFSERSAAWSARAAAWSAESVATPEAWKQEASDLIELLKETN